MGSSEVGIIAAGSHRPQEMASLIRSVIATGHSGPIVIVDGSGDGTIWSTVKKLPGFSKLNSHLVIAPPDYLGRYRHNLGAAAAIELGATHLMFPNDYQTLLQLPSIRGEHIPPLSSPSIGVGLLTSSEDGNLVFTPPIHKEAVVRRESSWRARRRAWGSALESLLFISSDMFTRYGGWSELVIPGHSRSIAFAGDGLELIIRCLNSGGSIYPLPSLVLQGGHRGPKSDEHPNKFFNYGRGAIQMGRYVQLPEWYLGAQVIRAQMKALGVGLSNSPSIFGSRDEWRQRASGMRVEFLRRWRVS